MVTQSRAPLILLTRPEAGARRFAARLRETCGDLRILISPLMEPVFLKVSPPPGIFSALVLTSETAVGALRHLGWALPDLAYCVGAHTARSARALGMQTRVAPGGEAESLIRLVQEISPDGRLFWPHGREISVDIAARLTAAGIETTGAEVYHQVLRPLLDPARAAIAEKTPEPVILPVFSPRTANWLAQELGRAGPARPLRFAAISPAAALPLRDLADGAVEVATRPDASAMIAATERLLQRNVAVEPPGISD